jgi:hypothetical protein
MSVIYSVEGDFGGEFNSSQFHKEVVADVLIVTELYGINISGDTIELVFAAEIGVDERIELDNLSTSHAPVVEPEEVEYDEVEIADVTVPADVGLTFQDGDSTYMSMALVDGNKQITMGQQLSAQEVVVDKYLELKDIDEPVHPADGAGRLYKKTGSDGLWWKPDSAGTSVDVTEGGASASVAQQSVETDTLISTTNDDFSLMPGMEVVVRNGGSEDYTVVFSGEFESRERQDMLVAVSVNDVTISSTIRNMYMQSRNKQVCHTFLFKLASPLANGDQVCIFWLASNRREIKCRARTMMLLTS